MNNQFIQKALYSLILVGSIGLVLGIELKKISPIMFLCGLILLYCGYFFLNIIFKNPLTKEEQTYSKYIAEKQLIGNIVFIPFLLFILYSFRTDLNTNIFLLSILSLCLFIISALYFWFKKQKKY